MLHTLQTRDALHNSLWIATSKLKTILLVLFCNEDSNVLDISDIHCS